MPIARNSVAGFTLIEIAVVLFILSLLLVGGLNIITTQRSNLGFKQTVNRMDRLFEAMQLFLVRNNRLPCPAIPGLAKSDAAYAFESRDDVPCEADQEIGSTGVYWGTVPYRTLNLGAGEYADGWDNQIFYVVNGGAAAENSLNAGRWDAPSPIQLWDRATAPPARQLLISNGVFALVSTGPNGNGAYSLNGVERPAPIATSLDELDNLDADVQLVSADYSENERRPFDDIVRVYTEDQIMASIIRDGAVTSKHARTREQMERIAQSIIGDAADDDVDPDGLSSVGTPIPSGYVPPCILARDPVPVDPMASPPTFYYPCTTNLRTHRRRIRESDNFNDGNYDGYEDHGSDNAANINRGLVPYEDLQLQEADTLDAWGNPIQYDPGTESANNTLPSGMSGIWAGSPDIAPAFAIRLISYGPDGISSEDDLELTFTVRQLVGMLTSAGVKVD